MKKLIIVFIVFVMGVSVVFLFTNKESKNGRNIFENSSTVSQNSSLGYWRQDESGWKAIGTPPPCPDPLKLASITDVSKATSVLYPGQMRSVGYEPTAGFRFDGIPNDQITVTAPMDGEIVSAARFLVNGEIQYVFDILSSCGVMNRFDHLLTLPPKFQAVADKLPEPKENDSRSTFVSPPVIIMQGEILATAVGLKNNNNSFISWTVFDFRKKNRISQNATWAEQHPELDHYAICPFPYLPQKDQELIRVLPAADIMSGSKSDFCN